MPIVVNDEKSQMGRAYYKCNKIKGQMGISRVLDE